MLIQKVNALLDKSGKVASLKRKSSLGSTPRQGTSFRMLTANLYTQLLIENVKIHPVYYGGYSVVEAPESVKLVVRDRYPLVTPIMVI